MGFSALQAHAWRYLHRGGTERAIRESDVVYVPAGASHGIRDTDGITFFNVRFDTK
jgi:mannose-6-phosphate isomerase-like protein (cupin superfamily)